MTFGRRQFVHLAAMAAAAAGCSRQDRGPSFAADPFALGVASGDPSPDGFVLWTRLAPDPLNGGGVDGDVGVRWEIASDDAFRQVVRSGTATASAELAHSVHVEIAGLEADRWYWYRFFAGDAVSAAGRARTMPTPESLPDRLSLAFASCQHYETGFYTAYEHMAAEHPDLVFHLGDYIYEGPAQPRIRAHRGEELASLEDYRNRYALYRTDPDLQLAHAACPWMVTWDDHEVDNNYAADVSEQPDVRREAFLERRAAAYQAYYEHMPLRASQIPSGPSMRLYRKLSYGRLAQFTVLDTRQYRTDQPCGDRTQPPCEGASDPAATLLGDGQRRWLFDALRESSAEWNVIPQQVMMAQVDRMPGDDVRYSMDQWPGYAASRDRLLGFLAESRVRNPVVLTGDIHTNWVNDLLVDFGDPASPVVATEFVGTSISSSGDGGPNTEYAEGVMRDNPFVKLHNAQRGYVSCEVTRGLWTARYRVLDRVSERGAARQTLSEFAVETGRPGAQRA
ncbi:MAG: alkaline phosphatase [Acidobacteriia bacterium]|nr:alkaline phosphatase [Terriglobia bacterium]MYG03696.1 alkaline phosphatase [Terriglobia bacterium]MYK12132.1 alkaline phosphatase [Terriglobia bacterium]